MPISSNRILKNSTIMINKNIILSSGYFNRKNMIFLTVQLSYVYNGPRNHKNTFRSCAFNQICSQSHPMDKNNYEENNIVVKIQSDSSQKGTIINGCGIIVRVSDYRPWKMHSIKLAYLHVTSRMIACWIYCLSQRSHELRDFHKFCHQSNTSFVNKLHSKFVNCVPTLKDGWIFHRNW